MITINTLFTPLEQYFEQNPLDGKLRSSEKLSRYTSFRCGGNAEFFCDVYTIEGLKKIVSFCSLHNIELKVLGFGTDLLVADTGVAGAVIRLMGPVFYTIEQTDDLILNIGSRSSLRKIILESGLYGFSGCEWFAGIPASLGGALSLNAGAFGRRIGDLIQDITALLPDGRIRVFLKEELGFGYRKGPFSGGEIIISARVAFKKGDPQTIKDRATSIMQERTRKLPRGYSAGCVFKNMPEIPAGMLIDQLGLKGARVGEAVVSPVHANFIINENNAHSSDVLSLIDRIRQKAKQERGLELNLEIKIWG